MAKPRIVIALVVLVVVLLGLGVIFVTDNPANTADQGSIPVSTAMARPSSTTVAEPPDWFQVNPSTSEAPTTTLAPTTAPATTTPPAAKAAAAPHLAHPQPSPVPPAGQTAPPCTYRGMMVQTSAGWVYYIDSACTRHHVPDPGTRDCLIHQGVSGPYLPSDATIGALAEAGPKYCMGTFLRLPNGWVWMVDCSDGPTCAHPFRRHASGTCGAVVDITQDVTDGLPTGADFGPSECGRCQ